MQIAATQNIDHVFRALSDPTRRDVLERLSKSPASVSELAAPFKMALPSFVQHLRILEDSGLVRSHKTGCIRTYQLAPKRLKLAEDWLSRQRSLLCVCVLGTPPRPTRQLFAYPEGERRPMRVALIKPDPKLDLVLDQCRRCPTRKKKKLVWAAWTTPEHLRHWFVPKPWTITDCEVDLRPGGLFRSVRRSPEGQEFPNIGCYLDIVPNERMIWTDALLPGYRPSEKAVLHRYSPA